MNRVPVTQRFAAALQGKSVLLISILIVTATASFDVCAYANDLIANGLLSSGSGGQPKGWQYETFDSQPGAASFEWMPEAPGMGVLKISNPKPNDSRWVQTFAVSPSKWYRVSGLIRPKNVGTEGGLGAYSFRDGQ